MKCDIVFFELNELSIPENRHKTFFAQMVSKMADRRLKTKKSEHNLCSRVNENQNLSILFCKSTLSIQLLKTSLYFDLSAIRISSFCNRNLFMPHATMTQYCFSCRNKS